MAPRVRQRRSAFRSQCWSLVHPFQQVFEVVEPALPEPGHLPCPVDQRGKRIDLRAIVRLAALVAVAHQPGPPQDPEMLRDCRLRNPGASRQGPDRLLSFATQSLENGPPGWIGEGSEQRILSVRHWRSITFRLLIDT